MSRFFVFLVISTLIFQGFTKSVTNDNKELEFDSNEFESKEKPDISPEVAKALQPTEQAILDFVTKLVNTGYISSKISLRRIEKSTDKRRAIGEEVKDFLDQLPHLLDQLDD